MSKYFVAALISLFPMMAMAANKEAIDPAELFADYLGKTDPTCVSRLNQSWGTFTGPGNEYKALEQKYLEGAADAAICGIRWGYSIYILLDELHKIQKAGLRDLQAAARQAERQFDKMPISTTDTFMSKVDCKATTPPIRFSGYFTQTVRVACTTPRGPAAVDLDSLHIRVGAKDAWNGNGSFFGRSL